MRRQCWEIVEHEGADGTSYEVTRGNRSIAAGLRSRRAAGDIVQRSRQAGEKVYFVEPDGYRTDLTKRFSDPPEPVKVSADLPIGSSRPIRARYLARYGRDRLPASSRVRATKE